MAILAGVPGLKVEILVNGEPLREYDEDRDEDDEPSEPNTITKYVEVVSGAEFQIKYTFKRPFPSQKAVDVDFHFDSLTDGVVVNQTILFNPSGHWYVGPESRIGGRTQIQKLSFSDLEIGESGYQINLCQLGNRLTAILVEGSAKNHSSDLKRNLADLGTIRVRFRSIKSMKRVPPVDRIRETLAVGEIPEKALKGQTISHQIRWGIFFEMSSKAN